MTPTIPAPPEVRHPAAVIVLGGWMLIQTAVVTATDSVRLWPHHPAPPQSLALAELTFVQILAVALFSRLIDRWSTAVMIAAAGVFFGQIAAIEASVPTLGTLRTAAVLGLWIGSARLSNGLGCRFCEKFGPAILVLWAVFPTLRYFGLSEQSAAGQADLSLIVAVGGVERAVRQVDSFHWADLSYVAIPGLCFFLFSTLVRTFHRNQTGSRP